MSHSKTDPLQRSQRDPVVFGCLAFAAAVVVLGIVIASPEVHSSSADEPWPHASEMADDDLPCHLITGG